MSALLSAMLTPLLAVIRVAECGIVADGGLGDFYKLGMSVTF